MGALLAAAGAMVLLVVAAVMVPLAALGGDGADEAAARERTPGGDVPALATEMWGWLAGEVDEQCPEMDVAWLGALIEVESD